MPQWVTDLALVACAVISVIVTWLTQRSATAKMEGAAGQRLQNVEGDIIELKLDNDKQWEKITSHGERIARLER